MGAAAFCLGSAVRLRLKSGERGGEHQPARTERGDDRQHNGDDATHCVLLLLVVRLLIQFAVAT